MSSLNAVEITEEEFLRAKRIICEGIDDFAFLNVFIKNLRIYFGQLFDVREDPDENPIYEGEEIIRKYKIMTYVEGRMVSLSIDEFFFHSIQKWNPDTASYLSYVYNLLINYHARVPVEMTTEQKVHWRQLKPLINVVKSIKPELDIENLPFGDLIPALDQYLPAEYRRKMRNLASIYMPKQSLDMVISEDDNGSETLIDILESPITPSGEERPISKEDPHITVEKAYNKFTNAKLTKSMSTRIRLYATVELIQGTINYLSFDDYRKLAARYPDFIVDVDWIEQIYNENTAEHPEFAVSTRMPSQKQQAEHLDIDYHSYCNSIMRYKKKLPQDN